MDAREIELSNKKVGKRYFYHAVKRIFDFFASGIALIILSPLFAYVAYRIHHEDGGKVFYKQKRIGKNGKEFEMIKFRSMVENADQLLEQLREQNEIDGAMFKMRNDPRVTKIGHFIREHSIDELPQLWNVLIGDMSLVGPRPPLPEEVADYNDYDMQRLSVMPGCTGLWQVTLRNDASFDQMVQLDLEYIRKSSIWFDLWIMFKTVGIMFKPNDAY